ncbi:MAG: UDP-N-acetylglucosamine 2-epimerase (hydrolyzing) [Sneathiella sp.]|nr:UDP-N-acetylglucosamine 2-epimerase (hydrolyzing) [Sneathiella sp.]
MSRRIAVFTGNRAEYGLLFPILKSIKNHPELDLQLVVAGAHLDPNFGQSMSEILSDGFKVDAEAQIDLGSDEAIATPRAIATGILSISNILQELNPDIFVVYADRFEGFAAIIAASQMNIPVAHIEGGDITEGGALDDSVRHAMTKLAHIHFTTNQQASNRLLAMGEEDWRVHTAGFPAIDMILNGEVEDPQVLEKKYNLDQSRPVILFTQHSITTEYEEAEKQLGPSLRALEKLANEGIDVIVTFPNNDVGGFTITEYIERFFTNTPTNMMLHKSLGRYNYHGILALSKHPSWRVVCAGNSSSGIKETPIFGCPTVNIGSRQQGRLRGDNVIDANYDEGEIYQAIHKALFDESFREQCRNTENPYGGGEAGKTIAEALFTIPLDRKRLLRKKMTLKGEANDGWYQ